MRLLLAAHGTHPLTGFNNGRWLQVVKDDLTLGRSVALLAAKGHGRVQGVEDGVTGWGLAWLVVERLRGWLADTDDEALALLHRLEADPNEEATQALALGIDLLLNQTSRIGRDLRSLIRQAYYDEILAPVLGREPIPTIDPVAEVSFQLFDPATRLFPDDDKPEAEEAKGSNGNGPSNGPSSSKGRPAKGKGKRKRKRRGGSSPNGNSSSGKTSNSTKRSNNDSAIGRTHHLFPSVEPPTRIEVDGDIFSVKTEDDS